MIPFTIILTILTAVLLIISAVLQSSKKEGDGNTLGSMGAHQIIGVKRTSDLLERSTWVLLILLFMLSLGTFALVKSGTTNVTSPNLARIQQKNALREAAGEGAYTSEAITPTVPTESTDDTQTE